MPQASLLTVPNGSLNFMNRFLSIFAALCVLAVGLLGASQAFKLLETGTPPPAPSAAKKNPFEAESGPHAVCDEVKYNFGKMLANTAGEHRFVIKNTGTGVLKLADGGSSCPACTIAGLEKQTVAPGEEAGVTVKWNPVGQHAEFSKYVKVWTNDKSLNDEPLVLTVEGAVLNPVYIDTMVLNFEPFHDDQPKPFTIHVVSGFTDDLQVTVQASSDRVTYDVVSLPKEEGHRFGPAREDGGYITTRSTCGHQTAKLSLVFLD